MITLLEAVVVAILTIIVIALYKTLFEKTK